MYVSKIVKLNDLCRLFGIFTKNLGTLAAEVNCTIA